MLLSPVFLACDDIIFCVPDHKDPVLLKRLPGEFLGVSDCREKDLVAFPGIISESASLKIMFHAATFGVSEDPLARKIPSANARKKILILRQIFQELDNAGHKMELG